MSGFIEWEYPCPQCKQLTAVLDTGKVTEELICNNDKCGYSHSFELTDKGWKGHSNYGHCDDLWIPLSKNEIEKDIKYREDIIETKSSKN